jgi:8-oxo-dGTP diphosphatase
MRMLFFWRIAYIVAYRVLRVAAVFGLRLPGAFVAVWCGPRVLLLKSSYQPFHSFPGGIARPREDARAAALREVAEEVGIHLEATDLEPVPASPALEKLRRAHVTLFTAHLASEPPLQLQQREILWAGFVGVDDPRVATLWSPFRAYVLSRRPPAAPGQAPA